MIISVSRRTDIPAFYSEWFFNRIKAGYVMVRNPFNKHQISKIALQPEIIDCLVFWTKNPEKLLNKLNILDELEYNYYFQFTITPYGNNIEKNVPDKNKIIDIFMNLSERIGKHKVIWRYDPIILTDNIDIQYHFKYFNYIARYLKGYTEKVVISFVDYYKKCLSNLKRLNAKIIGDEEKTIIAQNLSAIGKSYQMVIETCGEKIDLSDFGINRGKCIDDKLVSRIIGKDIDWEKDKSQRDECGCINSVDIGSYNTCKHNCLYCYANYSNKIVEKNVLCHRKESPLLVGEIDKADKIIDREISSCIKVHRKLF